MPRTDGPHSAGEGLKKVTGSRSGEPTVSGVTWPRELALIGMIGRIKVRHSAACRTPALRHKCVG